MTSSQRPGRSQRGGFTLIELLVATAVFVFGFTAAFGMFLAALRYRTLADDTIKLSLASGSIAEEIAIGKTLVPSPPTTPLAPLDYVGDGMPTAPLPPTASTTGELYPYAQVPGTWYIVESCTDLLGDPTNSTSATLHAQIIVVSFSQGVGPTLPLEDVWNRLRPRASDLPELSGSSVPPPRLTTSTTLTPEQRTAFFNMLVRRGLAVRQQAVILRRPAWMI